MPGVALSLAWDANKARSVGRGAGRGSRLSAEDEGVRVENLAHSALLDVPRHVLTGHEAGLSLRGRWASNMVEKKAEIEGLSSSRSSQPTLQPSGS